MRVASRSSGRGAVAALLVSSLVTFVSSVGALGCDKHEETPTSTVATSAPSAPSTISASSGAAAASISVTAPPAPSAMPAIALSPADTKVRQIFATRCASCHGLTGKGDGPIAASLTPHPRNYSDATWQSATSDAAIAAVISKGGAAVGKSQMMPPSPDLAADPASLAAMVKLVRSFASGS